MKYRFTCLLMVVFSSHLWSQGVITVDGFVTDPVEDVTLSDVLVYLEGSTTAYTTNDQGAFSLSFTSDKDTVLVISRVGYKRATYPISHSTVDEHLALNVELVPAVSDLEVVVQSTISQQPGMIVEDVSEIKLLPSVTGNLENILPHIALGVSGGTGGELSSQYNVRGGNYDENLVYVNDFQIYRPQLIRSGQQEGLSFPNPDLIRDISFSSGGFSVRYGDKMSSVLDIKYKRPDTAAYSAELSLLGASAHMEGSKSLGDSQYRKFRYLVGGRYRSTAYLLNTLDVKGEYLPKFADVQSYLTFDLNESWQAGLLLNYNRSVFDFEPQTRSTASGLIDFTLNLTSSFTGAERDKFETAMAGVSMTYLPPQNKNPFFLKFLASTYQSAEAENFDILSTYNLSQIETSIGAENQGEAIALVGEGIQHQYVRNLLLSNVSNFEIKGGLEKNIFSSSGPDQSHFLQWGLKFQHEDIRDRLNEWERLDSAGYSLPYNGEEVQLAYNYKSRNELSSQRLEAYFMEAYNIRNSGKSLWTFEGGVRASYWTWNDELNISPRGQIVYRPLGRRDNQVFRLAAGLYYQPPFYREFRQLDGTLNTDIRSQKSTHVVLGYSTDFYWEKLKSKMRFTTEAYYKKLSDLIPYDVNNVRIRYYGDNLASGHVMGIDFRLNGELVPGAESWINLSFLKAIEKWDGIDHQKLLEGIGNFEETEYVPRPTDQRVTASIFFQDYLPQNENFKIHLSLNFGSGLPFGTPDENIILRNPFRHKIYYRMDAGFSAQLWDRAWITRRPNNPFRFAENAWISLEVFNLLQVANTASVTWIKAIDNVQYSVKNNLTSRRINLKLRFEF